MRIEFNNVSLFLNHNTILQKKVLNNINFELLPGLKYTFYGNSNSGKTLIGELINALIKPDKGYIKIGEFINNGKKIKNINELRFLVGLVTKNADEMFFNKTVRKELEFGIKYFKYKVGNIYMRTIDALKIVGLDESYLNKKINDLTLSEIKKVQLASVIVYNPKILILDEPTIHLNFKEKKDLLRILNILNTKYNKTIILLSRDANFIYEFDSYIYVMDHGNIVLNGNNDILLNQEELFKYNLSVPDIVKFINIANKNNFKLKQYKDIKDLIKGVCNNVL